MSGATPVLSAATLLKNFTFTYFPVTDWRRFVSPTVVFGTANIADREIEQQVVDSVGSYGYQLNRILDLADAADEAAKRATASRYRLPPA